MFDLPVKSLMEPKKLVLLAPETTVAEAAKRMATKNTGATLVMENDTLIGIFTERDAVFRVLAKGLDAHATLLRQVMTPNPATLAPNTTYGHALLLMHERGFRHVPVVEGSRVLGIVAARNAMDPQLEEFVSEARRREHYREATT
ncbi:cyclic nucleotide-binding/CBS domain-containing protein [Candidatus Aalborgicola defluviihabitans]|uniref:CBS domain-containing protein n=1 Tax=Candidatus Aalborgicola defluviihabitans TaxID=3386187 RepID=UPI001DAE280B|nr:CBS domain-containing protein [Burkholderiales bacterium]MBK7314441.1 CBS domain-containing protein [Burkholderiales bacterium]MBL0244165.1 CBS domain-containing protein [Rhodoferax sp.]